MNINCYYEYIPVNENIRWAWTYNFSKMPDFLQERYPEHKFNKIHRWSGNMGHKNPWDGIEPYDKNKHPIISDTIFIIENEDTKKYFVISTWDKCYWELHIWSDLKEKCVEIFTPFGMQLNDWTYELAPMDYTPINLPLNILHEEHLIDELYYDNLEKNNRIIPEKLFFQSLGAYGFREHIYLKDPRFDFHNAYSPDIREWLTKLSRYKINIDINCAAEVSNRTGEILGLGCVLLRPEIRHQFHNPLIPNYHYVAVEHDYFNGGPIDDFYASLADAYINTFNKIKDDKDYLDFISKNGREYFDKYIRREKWINDLLNLIDLNKLS